MELLSRVKKHGKRIGIIVFTVLMVTVAVGGSYIYSNIYREQVIREYIILGGEKPGYASLNVVASYHIALIRDGRVVEERVKENDPITIQWYRLVANMMLGFVRKSGNSQAWFATDGNTYRWIDIEQVGYNSSLRIVLGTGAGTPSRNDYKMFAEYTSDTPSMSVVDDQANNRYVVTATKSFTITSSATLTEVGLYLYVDVDTSGGTNGKYILIAHDIINPPVSVVTGDTVTVTYTITIPYNTNGPFTRWFYNALISYFLGYKGTTGNQLGLKAESGNWGSIDTGGDYHIYPYDNIAGEYTYIEVGSGKSTVSPFFETYVLASLTQRMRNDDAQFYVEANETSTSFVVRYIVSFSFTSSTTVSEIGVSYYTDRDGSGVAGDYYLWLYWALSTPVSISAGNGLRVEVIIVIPYA
mgnify:CR=1 FL=1